MIRISLSKQEQMSKCLKEYKGLNCINMYGFSVLVNTFQNSKRQLAKLVFNWLTNWWSAISDIKVHIIFKCKNSFQSIKKWKIQGKISKRYRVRK